jgi:hypothetical protein
MDIFTRRTARRLAAIFIVWTIRGVTAPGAALAECGDVNGDGAVQTSDALGVLKKAVGQDVALTCENDPPAVQNFLGYANTLTCHGYGFTSTMTWSERPGLRWKDWSQPYLPSHPVFYRVDAPVLDGKLIMSLGDCGNVKFPLDSWGIAFPMPLTGGAWVSITYDRYTDELFLNVNLEAYDTLYPALQSGPAETFVASVPAPAGIGGLETLK